MTTELELLSEQIASCTKCELCRSRTRTVPGEGPANAAIMFVGEGPGMNEDQQGRPFVGAAGRLLNELLKTISLDRSQVFITNIVKCRPPDNRAPRKSEAEACHPYLVTQISLIKPMIICPLGTPAIVTLLGVEYSATKSHGEPVAREGITYLPMYHPAAALYDASLKPTLENDFRTLKTLLENSSPGSKEQSFGSRGRETLEEWA
ncbi:MAG TPA: uracil-DNA glycosylase [Candidatus Bathyarchaeia archaeon]|nr:uracil-DNA glycosylase [Candidatus Bathyarchaeia archaeon]